MYFSYLLSERNFSISCVAACRPAVKEVPPRGFSSDTLVCRTCETGREVLKAIHEVQDMTYT
jgi:hypothetical protein